MLGRCYQKRFCSDVLVIFLLWWIWKRTESGVSQEFGATLHPHWACFDRWVRPCCCRLDPLPPKKRCTYAFCSVTVSRSLRLWRLLPPSRRMPWCSDPRVPQTRRERAGYPQHQQPPSPVATPGAPCSAWPPPAAVSPAPAAALELQLPAQPSAGSALSPETPSRRSCVEGPGWPSSSEPAASGATVAKGHPKQRQGFVRCLSHLVSALTASTSSFLLASSWSFARISSLCFSTKSLSFFIICRSFSSGPVSLKST